MLRVGLDKLGQSRAAASLPAPIQGVCYMELREQQGKGIEGHATRESRFRVFCVLCLTVWDALF